MLGLSIEKRLAPSRWVKLAVSGISIGLGLLIGSIIIVLLGFDPIYVYSSMFESAFGSVSGLARTTTKIIPLLLVAVGLSVAYKARVWNIGAPGQMAMGAIAGTGVALFLFPHLSSPMLIPIMFAAGFAAGAGLAAICAFLNYKIGVNMVISTLLLNYVAFKLLEYLIYGPWQAPGLGFPYTKKLSTSAQIPTLSGTSIHYPTLILAAAITAIIYLVMSKSSLGYEIKLFGDNPQAAEYAGISRLKIIMLVMIISGGFAGLAGVGEVAGLHHVLKRGVTGAGWVYAASYGYTAIFIAWLGRNNPLGVLLATFFAAGILVGGQGIQLIGLPFATLSVILGLMLIILMGGTILTQYKITFERGETSDSG